MSRAWKNWNTQVGATFVELMVVIAITGIIASIGLPTYRGMVVSSRVSSLASELHSAFLLARAEALKRRAWVGICKSSNADSAGAACDASASTAGANVGWGSGWIVYVDSNRNNVFDGGEPLIRVWGRSLKQASDGSMVPSNGVEQVMFGFTGQTATAVNFVIAAPSGYSDQDRAVCLAIGGRARVGRAPNCL